MNCELGYFQTENPDSVMVLKNSFEQQTLGIYQWSTINQTSQLTTHYPSLNIGPNNGTKVGQSLFMEIHLINHQRLDFRTVFQGFSHNWLSLGKLF